METSKINNANEQLTEELRRFKARLIGQIILGTSLCLIGILGATYGTVTGATQDYTYGLCIGAAAAVLATGIHRLMRARRVDCLREYYAREHDERLAAIRAKSGLPMVLYLMVGMLCATFVALALGQETVADTLIATEIACGAASLLSRAYWSRRI